MRDNQKKVCAECPLAKVAAIVGDLWTILIIRDLLEGPKRFGELAASLEGISTRTLTNKLKELEQHAIISKAEFRESPPRVEYSLTELGKELSTITEAMKKYGTKYL